MTKRLEEEGISFMTVPFYTGFLYVKPVFKHTLIPFLFFWDLIICPIIIFKSKIFNPDIIYSNSSLENIGFFVARLLGKKHIFHIREFMSKDFNSHFIFGEKMKKRFINSSDGVIFVSKSVKDHVITNQTSSSKNQVIYNGIKIPQNLPQKTDWNVEHINMGLVGIFDKAKGQHLAVEYLTELLKSFPKVQLHLFGDKEGGYKKQILRLIKKNKLENNIVSHGFVTTRKIIFESIDVLLMFSKSEGFGRVTIEAMRYGIPVIGYDNAGTSEIIADRNTGCLFKDYSSFESSLKYLFLSHENYNHIREDAFKMIKDRFSEHQYVKKVEDYIELVNQA